jgi:FMN phosphatase YigB (HAD superfamily)
MHVPTVQSFDVFDTVLTRQVGAPTAVIDVLSKRLETDGSLPVPAAVFAATRNAREWQLTQTLGRHATLREIYGAVAAAVSVGDDHADAWAAAEEALDEELTVAVPGAAQRLESARRDGPVVFVSDTPHSEAFLKRVLIHHGLAREEDQVFTSSDRGVSKSHGGLFEVVGQAFGDGHSFSHQGDSLRSDVAAARVEGWSGAHVPDAQLSRYEELLEQYATQTDGLTSWLAGASRLARLEAAHEGTPAPVAAVASGALAPLLVGFALWVTAQARQRGIRRLYYVARDGQSMLQAASHVIGRLAPDIELHFLYGSRKPWIFGACATSSEILEDWVLARPDYTSRTLLSRVDLTPERVHELTGLHMCSPENADKPLVRGDRVALAEALQRPPLLPLVCEGAERTAEVTLKYLRQEGFGDDVPSALVDAGWGGWTSYSFDHLLRESGARQVEHLLMGIRGSSDELARRETTRLVPWLFDEQAQPASMDRLPMPHTLVEVLCAGTMGRTIGYEVRGGEAHPVLSAETNEPVVGWGLPEVQRTAERVAELVAPHLDETATHLDLTDVVFAVLGAFWVDPTPAEAEAWGTFPWEEEIWPPYAPLAQRMTTRDVLAHLKQGDLRIRRVNSWRAGSATVSSEPWRTLLRVRGWQTQNRNRFRRVPRRLKLEIASRRRR